MGTNKTSPKGLALRKKPRLTAMERLAIETGLDAGKTPYAIAQELGRPPKNGDLPRKARSLQDGIGLRG